MKKAPQLTTENSTGKSQESSTKTIWQKLRAAKLSYTTALMLILSSCGSEPGGEIIEEPNKLPTGSITNLVSNDATNTVSGKFNGSDADGTISQKTLKAEASDGSSINVPMNADGTFNFTFRNSGKTYTMLIGLVKDNDGASTDVLKNLSPTVTVESPNQAPTIAFTLNNFDENTPIGTIVGNINANDPDGDALTYTITEGGDKFELDGTNIKTKVDFNHEDLDNTHTLKIQVSDGDLTDEDQETATENDVQEEQTINVLGDNELLPNGEKYAIKTDEEESGQTLPTMYYNHNNSRRLESEIENEIVNSSVGYSDAQTDINDLNGTGLAPTFGNGQAMVSFDGTTNEMIIHTEDGSESVRIGRNLYGQMMRRIMVRTGINDSINFVQDGTVLNSIWEDMIVLQANNPTKFYLSVDKAIQNHLAQ